MKKLRFAIILSAVTLLLCSSAFGAGFAKIKTYNGTFKDVDNDSWYADSVKQVYELSLMEGVAADKFDTESEMTVAQAITLAARIHSIYNNTTAPKVTSGANWYSEYVSYCLNAGIIHNKQFDSYNRPVLSYEMVQLFAAALPQSFFPQKNEITYIQDVPQSVHFYDEVLLFYKAGILNGNDEYGTFLPMSAITRKRAAVILARTVLPEERLTFTLSPKRENYTFEQVLSIIDMQTKKESLDELTVATAGSYKLSAAEYRYYLFISENDKAILEEQIKSTAAIYSALKDMNLGVSFETLCDILSLYYSERTVSYGSLTYFGALETQSLTDSVFARLIAVNELYYNGIKTMAQTISPDEVYNYAINNDYICAKHILISKDTPDAYKTALELQLSITNGADFDELLKTHGTDPGMKARDGGYYFTKNWMVKPFEDAAYALRENAVSTVVESEFGYHIIKRLPIIKEELLASPDYVTIAANAGSASFYNRLSAILSAMSVTYTESFDGISSLL